MAEIKNDIESRFPAPPRGVGGTVPGRLCNWSSCGGIVEHFTAQFVNNHAPPILVFEMAFDKTLLGRDFESMAAGSWPANDHLDRIPKVLKLLDTSYVQFCQLIWIYFEILVKFILTGIDYEQ